jgi:hypothetical protein
LTAVDTAPGTVSTWSDFSKWTPGLERMFAPTNPRNNWF